MTRSIDAGPLADIQSATPRIGWLVDLLIDSGSLFMWTGVGPLSANGNTYTGTGNLGSVSGIGETVEVRPTGITLRLSGVASSLISIVASEHLQGRTAKVYLATFTDAGVLEGTVLMFQGRIDNPQTDDDGTEGTITIPVENRLADFDRPNQTLFYTHEDQQNLYSGDLAFEFVEALVEQDIYWGQKQPKAKTTTVTGGGGGSGGGGSGGGGDDDGDGTTQLDPSQVVGPGDPGFEGGSSGGYNEDGDWVNVG